MLNYQQNIRKRECDFDVRTSKAKSFYEIYIGQAAVYRQLRTPGATYRHLASYRKVVPKGKGTAREYTL